MSPNEPGPGLYGPNPADELPESPPCCEECREEVPECDLVALKNGVGELCQNCLRNFFSKQLKWDTVTRIEINGD